ncbi:MAG: hypothetical protein EOP47_19045 [Sphingobacteriaceae bacterium]|nr:MAG: hypothetical protein EOP47_19045 [Sphingobacteriaceae bacterium]
MVKNAPYKFTEFKYLVFEYGYGDSLQNKYNSKTHEYQYVNSKDSVVKTTLKLNKDDLLYLHRKAADLGFWNFPSNELNDADGKLDPEVPHYKIAFYYARKSKSVIFAANYNGNPTLKDANERLIKEIQKVITIADERNKKK